MKPFSILRSLALLLMIGAGAAYAADAAKPAEAAKTATAGKAKKVAKAPAPVKVVYHANLGNEQAEDVLRNVGNHLNVDPTAKVVVVTHANGVDFLLQGAKDKRGNDFATKVQDLSLRGVDFRVCNITLVSRKIDPATVLSEAKIVPSGVAEIARLQFREHYAYVKP